MTLPFDDLFLLPFLAVQLLTLRVLIKLVTRLQFEPVSATVPKASLQGA